MNVLEQVLVLLTAAVVAVPLFRKAGLSAVLAYLIAGMVVGPWVLNLIPGVEKMLQVSGIGVVLLLFLIGLELQPARLWALRRPIFGMGPTQVIATTIVLAFVAHFLNLPLGASIIVGFGLSLSSTAFVLQMLSERRQLGTVHGRAGFSMLLFQDLAITPALAILRLGNQAHAQIAWYPFLIAVIVITAFWIGGRYLLRPIFRMIATFGIRETFSAAALLVVLGAAMSLEAIGLSMPLGAFLAGILLADSEYRHELEASIEPFKGLLLGLFFLAVGMSTNLGTALMDPGLVIALTFALLAIKGVIIYLVGRAFNLAANEARALAINLSQGGEFAFVLFALAASFQVLPRHVADLLAVVVALSMAATPVLIILNEKFLDRRPPRSTIPAYDRIDEIGKPVIIAGFGRFGQIVARILRMHHIPFTALEKSVEQVDFVRKYGNKIYYGDASHLDILRAAGADKARAFVLAINDIEGSVRTAKVVRRHFPELPIYACAKNRRHAHLLMEVGLTHIVREALFSSLELSERLLAGLGMPEPERRRTLEIFKRHDEETLHQQFAVFRDQDRLLQTSREAMAELESLFEADSKVGELSARKTN